MGFEIKPQVTVLMAVYNGTPYLRTAIDSILGQTYSDFLFLIVDDASTDDTRETVKSYTDERIKMVCLNQNVGQAIALNAGIQETTTPWIARMDSDDYSAPTRLEEQMQFLNNNPSITCLGTHIWTFQEDPQIVETVVTTPLAHSDIRRELLRRPSIIHGSLVVKREALLEAGGYDERYRVVTDLVLYDRLLNGYCGANIPRQLLGVRQHDGRRSGSELAFDEGLEICSQRLLEDGYSKEEIGTIRISMSRAYLQRAAILGARRKFVTAWRDVWLALRASPSNFIWHCFSIFVLSRMTHRRRATLRGISKRIVSRIFGKLD